MAPTKKVSFHNPPSPKQVNINDEIMTLQELDDKINPYVDMTQEAPPTPTPKELSQEASYPKRIRVARPLRHVKHKPTKEITYNNNRIFPKFSYDKIKLPLKPNTVIVQVKYFALNPIDLKMWNYYTSDLSGALKGFGREFSGVVYEAAEDSGFQPGDKVSGLYYHLFHKGCSASHILVDTTKDPMVRIDDTVASMFSDQKLAAWNLNYVMAFQVLNLIHTGGLNAESTVLVNGASTGTGMMTIQILKHYFHVNNIVAICSGTASDLVTGCGASIVIDYKKELDIIKAITSLLTNGKKTIIDRHGNEVEVLYPDKKFDIIIDFLGGYQLIENHDKILNEKNSTYLTTVGDKRADYRNDKTFIYTNTTNYLRNTFGTQLLGVNYKMVNFDYSNTKEIVSLMKKAQDLMKQGQLTVAVNSVFKFGEIQSALKKLKTQHALGKIVVEVEDF